MSDASSRIAVAQQRLAAGDAGGARAELDAVLAQPSLAGADRFAALVARSRAREALRELPLAIVDLEGALALDASQARVWNDLGILCADVGSLDRALEAFARATRADASYARGWSNLANALRSAGRTAEALTAAEHAVGADARYAVAWSNLGALRRDVGDDGGAEEALRRALALDARQRGAAITLAGLLRDRGDLASAAELFARAAQSDTRDANACRELGQVLAERDDLPGARAALDEAQRRDPRMLRATLARALALPMVSESKEAVDAARASFAEGLSHLERELPMRASSLSADRLVDELRYTSFLLPYQGEDDRELQTRYGTLVDALVRARAADWTRPVAPRARGGRRLRVGFASMFFVDGTVGSYFERWITDLPRDRFEVFVYHLVPGRDAVGERIAARADTFRHCAWWRPSQLAPRIRADALDVLVYPELGMGQVTFALATLRLAPRQLAGWGHPVTTGLPAIDAYLSCACMEPVDAASHYREPLVTLPGIGTRYAMPAAPTDASRERFGLPEGVPLLLCPQSIFKIHPDNDALFADVLRAAPSALLVGFEARDPGLLAKLRPRWTRAGIDPARVRFLPRCARDDYLRINTLCDAMLDTVHWSGGNTSLDALASGLPIVTLPGRFMRGRQSLGMLGLLGMDDLVARDRDDYVRKVAAIAADRSHRDALSSRIVDARGRVFDDASPIAALGEILERGSD